MTLSTEQRTSKNGGTNKQVFTFDDIDKYTRIYWKGQPGWVLDKGPHVQPAVKDARHLYIEFEDEQSGKQDSRMFHEKIVNKYLREKRLLWVDFGDRLFPVEQHDATT